MLESRPRNVQISPADVINRFVVNKKGTVRVLNRAMGGEYSIVRLHYGGRNLRGGIYRELKLTLFTIVS
jgi:hypothetical protein